MLFLLMVFVTIFIGYLWKSLLQCVFVSRVNEGGPGDAASPWWAIGRVAAQFVKGLRFRCRISLFKF